MADDPGCHHRAAIADSRGDFEQTSFCSYRRSLLALNRAAIGVVPAVRAGWARSKIVGGNQRSNRISAPPLDQGGRPSQVPKSDDAERSLTVLQLLRGEDLETVS